MSCGVEMLIKNQAQHQDFIDHIDDPAVNEAAIEEGQGIMMRYPPAMRDPRVFDDPDTFDIRRPAPASNLSFGHGCGRVQTSTPSLAAAITSAGVHSIWPILFHPRPLV